MADEVQEYLDLEGLTEYHSKVNALFEDLTIEEVEEAFNELDESDPSYSAFYDIITKAKEASKSAEDNAASAEAATEKANTAVTNAEEATTKANEASEKVNELIDTINDDTTGINLLRGTRDWTKGTDLLGTVFYSDGFYGIDLANVFSVEKDTDGFGMLVFNKSSASSSNNYVRASYISLDGIETLTISGEIKISSINVQPSDYFLRYFGLTSSGEQGELNPVSFENLGIDITKLNVWQTFKLTMDVSSIAKSNPYFGFHLLFGQNTIGTLFMKKLTLNEGSIRNPIWSASPFDVDIINDETTGINLLRGTRDFSVGSKMSSIINLYIDGFGNQSNATFTKDQTGFTVAHITANSGASAKALFSSFVENVKVGDTFTVAVDVMTDDISTLLSRDNVMIQFLNSASSAVQQTGVSLRGVISDLEANKWYRIHFSSKLTTENVVGVRVNLRLDGGGSIYFRKLCLYEGRINNPIWSASPFDIDYINDETTGINLFRGPRDFMVSTTYWSTSGYSLEGFNAHANRIIDTDNQGFAVCYAKEGLSTNAYSLVNDELKANAVYTMAFDYKLDTVNTYTGGETIGYLVLQKASGSSNPVSYLLDASNMKPGVWYTYIGYYTVPDVDLTDTYLRGGINLPKSGLKARKLRIYKGRINNSIWSASPFDSVEVQQLRPSGYYDVSSKITARSGYTLALARLFRSGNVAQLFMQIDHSSTLSADTTIYPIDINDDLLPITHAVANAASSGFGVINVGNKNLELRIVKDVTADTSLYVSTTFILRDNAYTRSLGF